MHISSQSEITHDAPLPMLEAVNAEMPSSDCRAWYIDTSRVDKSAVQICAYSTLSRAEFKRGLQMRTDELAIQHWCSRLVLRHALSIYTGFACQPQNWKIDKLTSGKLVLDHPIAQQRQLDFSITHAQGLTVCAISRGKRIGVDVEPVNRKVHASMINGRIFSPAELKILHKANITSRFSLALRLWTMKEACAKTLGYGLAMDFSTLRFSISQSGKCKLESLPSSVTDWRLQQHVFNHDYLLAIATARA